MCVYSAAAAAKRPTLPGICISEEVEIKDGLVVTVGCWVEECVTDEATQPSCTWGQRRDEKSNENSQRGVYIHKLNTHTTTHPYTYTHTHDITACTVYTCSYRH